MVWYPESEICPCHDHASSENWTGIQTFSWPCLFSYLWITPELRFVNTGFDLVRWPCHEAWTPLRSKCLPSEVHLTCLTLVPTFWSSVYSSFWWSGQSLSHGSCRLQLLVMLNCPSNSRSRELCINDCHDMSSHWQKTDSQTESRMMINS